MAQTSRRVNQGRIDVDFEDSAIIVNYEIETVLFDPI